MRALDHGIVSGRSDANLSVNVTSKPKGQATDESDHSSSKDYSETFREDDETFFIHSISLSEWFEVGFV